jgi:hypothetical protein
LPNNAFDQEPHTAESAPGDARADAKPFDLHAAALATQRPLAEVLTVVCHEPIVVFAEARTRPLHHFTAIEAWYIVSNPDAVAMSEILKRNVFDRSASQSVGKAGVVDDATVANVNAVMAIERSRADEMRRERRLITVGDEPLA